MTRKPEIRTKKEPHLIIISRNTITRRIHPTLHILQRIQNFQRRIHIQPRPLQITIQQLRMRDRGKQQHVGLFR